jgi:hypothetical protein
LSSSATVHSTTNSGADVWCEGSNATIGVPPGTEAVPLATFGLEHGSICALRCNRNGDGWWWTSAWASFRSSRIAVRLSIEGRLTMNSLPWPGPALDTVTDNQPDVRDLDVPRRALAVASAQNTTAGDHFIEANRSVYIGDGEKLCHRESVTRWRLMAFLLDSYDAH